MSNLHLEKENPAVANLPWLVSRQSPGWAHEPNNEVDLWWIRDRSQGAAARHVTSAFWNPCASACFPPPRWCAGSCNISVSAPKQSDKIFGYAALCIWGISPTIFVSLSQQHCFISQQSASFPQQNCFISPKTWVTSPTHFLISPTTLCHFATPKKVGMISHSKIVLPSCFVVNEENISALRLK